MTIESRNVIRVPNLPLGQIVDKDGKATDDELTFRQSLLTLLQRIIGNEGLVMPSQPTANITTIQNHQSPVQGSPSTVYTCEAGTFLYDSDTNQVKVAILVAGVPTFKVVQVV